VESMLCRAEERGNKEKQRICSVWKLTGRTGRELPQELTAPCKLRSRILARAQIVGCRHDRAKGWGWSFCNIRRHGKRQVYDIGHARVAPAVSVELAMFYRVIKCLFLALFVCATVLATSVLAQRPTPTQNPQSRGAVPSPLEGGDPTVNINVYVLGADGGPIEVTAVVTLIAATGQVLSQGTTLAGNIQFNGVAANNCTIQVVAPGYETTVKEFDSYSAES
jgi:hypothetical protein